MSSETKVFCDKCSTLITKDRTLITLTTGPDRLIRPIVDLCPLCLNLFLAWIDAGTFTSRQGKVDKA